MTDEIVVSTDGLALGNPNAKPLKTQPSGLRIGEGSGFAATGPLGVRNVR